MEVKTLSRGDRLLADGVEMEVLGPPPLGSGGNDNSNSIVLAIRLGDQSILLPGDLENVGMDLLLDSSPQHFEVVMAPHHGSRNSRPDEFLCWARPQVVVVSGLSSRVDTREIESACRHIRLLRTDTDGAIRIHMSRDGLSIETWGTDE